MRDMRAIVRGRVMEARVIEGSISGMISVLESRNYILGHLKVAGSSISSIFAFSARPSAQLDLRAHNVGLDTN